MKITSVSQKRRSELAVKSESFLSLASRTDKTATQIMQTSVRELLRRTLETKKYTMGRGLEGRAITAGFDLVDSAIKIATKKPEEISLPNLQDLNNKTKKLEERFARAEEKITTLPALQLFNVVSYLNKYGLEAALDYITIGKMLGFMFRSK
jgi:hypothetical protein